MRKIINYILSSLLVLLGFSSCKTQKNLTNNCPDYSKKNHQRQEKLIPNQEFKEPIRCMYGVPQEEFRYIEKNNPSLK